VIQYIINEMNIYKEFAHFYVRGHYPHFSEKILQLFPGVLKHFNIRPQTILDIACGEGTFALGMAKKGYDVTGIDLSQEMLQYAKEKARKENAKLEFFHQDMRSLNFQDTFNLATCWYDSLNYVLELEELEQTFAGVNRSLKRKGFFIFDMNTIYGLAVNWQKYPCYVQQDSGEIFEVHQPEYDFDKNIATLMITGFIKKEHEWERIGELHRERAFSLEEIRYCLKKTDFQELACWGSLREMTEPKKDSARIWFVARKTG